MMLPKSYKFLLLMLLASILCNAQVKNTTHYQRIWGGYFNQMRFSDHWGLWVDLQLRTQDDFIRDWSQGIARLGLTRYFGNHTKLTMGYAYIHDFPSDNHRNIATYEHRPWQQLQWHTRYGKKNMMQWLRLEQRFRRKLKNDDELAEGYLFNWRLRYNLWYEIPFCKSGTEPGAWSFIANDELHINFGSEIVYHYFDQNRFFTGFKYQTGAHSNLQAGYMNLFQQLPAGNQYRMVHALRLFFFQTMDLRKKHS